MKRSERTTRAAGRIDSGYVHNKGKGLRCMQGMWPGVELMFSRKPELKMPIANGRGALLTRQTLLLAASALMSWVLSDIKLAVAVLHGGDDVLIL